MRYYELVTGKAQANITTEDIMALWGDEDAWSTDEDRDTEVEDPS